MMTLAVRTKTIVQPGGLVEIRSPELTPGASAEVIVLVDAPAPQRVMTAANLLDSGLVGLWEDRTDIADSAEFARQLRRQAERRERAGDDPA
ncbi:MAG TPA: hypothetical protein VFL17_08485 [Anaerolineae bacterium]|nr:hypothetical protein [Anaerolineae bacterium]